MNRKGGDAERNEVTKGLTGGGGGGTEFKEPTNNCDAGENTITEIFTGMLVSHPIQ